MARWPSGVRVLVFLAVLAAVWLPVAIALGVLDRLYPALNLFDLPALVSLYGLFALLVSVWGRRVHGWRWPLRHLGLAGSVAEFARRWLIAAAIGAAAVWCLYGLELLLGWAVWAPRVSLSQLAYRLVPEGLVVGAVVGFAEELLFRGWLLAELEASGRARTALIANASVFALAHFIRPLADVVRTLPQFAGLVVLGLTLVWARRVGQRTSLALPMGLHGGLVWAYYLVDVGDLVAVTDRVPDWVTGIGGNPLAGLLGLGLLGAIALGFARCAQPKTSQSLRHYRLEPY